jgi:hypothetical protein
VQLLVLDPSQGCMSGLVSALYLSTFEGVFLFVSCCNECVSVDVFDGPVCGFYSI